MEEGRRLVFRLVLCVLMCLVAFLSWRLRHSRLSRRVLEWRVASFDTSKYLSFDVSYVSIVFFPSIHRSPGMHSHVFTLTCTERKLPCSISNIEICIPGRVQFFFVGPSFLNSAILPCPTLPSGDFCQPTFTPTLRTYFHENVLCALPPLFFFFFCSQQVGLQGTPDVLLDPNTLSTDGTSALTGVDFTKDGKKLAYGISKKGSDW